MEKVTSFFLSVLAFFLAPLICIFPSANDYAFEIDTAETGGSLPNAVSNVNIWNAKGSADFANPRINEENNVFDFVEYVQLMQCTGGNASRDLFVDPYNFDVLDDYDFSKHNKSYRLNINSLPEGIYNFTAEAKLGNTTYS